MVERFRQSLGAYNRGLVYVTLCPTQPCPSIHNEDWLLRTTVDVEICCFDAYAQKKMILSLISQGFLED